MMIRVDPGLKALVGALGCAGALAACKPVVTPAPDDMVAPKPAPVVAPKVEDLAIGRAELLRALADAASAAALGDDNKAAEARLAGRQFILKMPLGCTGESDAATGWTYDSASQRLTLKATPDISLDDVAPAKLAEASPPPTATTEAPGGAADKSLAAPSLPLPNPVEAVDGFWIERPWIFADRCPVADEIPAAAENTPDKPSDAAASDDPVPATAAPSTASRFGIAQLYTARDSRTGRRGGEAYSITRRVVEAERPDPKSLRLVLRGRLNVAPGGQLIQCKFTTPDVPPRCIISASFDRVSFENADGSTVYAQWGGS